MPEKYRYSKYEPLFGSWYIKEKIGQGAIGQVFEIERKELDTTYRAALKAITIPEGPEDIKRVLSSGVAREDLADYYRKLIRNIANEFKYLARLKGNSYIVNYEDHTIIESEGEMKWDVLIKTELLTPLIEHVIEHPLSEHDVLRLGMDICNALKFCARYNIIHRDIKPENIFIAPSGNYKLGDFGIARVVEETYVNLSRKGTYTYMAPEVFHGSKYDRSADLYSLGLVMYKYLNHGRIPFMPPYPDKISYDDTEKAFSERMSGKALPEPTEGSSKLNRVILRACAFDSSDRYDSAEEMLADLEELYVTEQKKRQKSEKIQKEKKKDASRSTSEEEKETSETAITEKKKNEKKKRTAALSGTQKKIASALAALIALAGAAYLLIPKEVTDISGIESEVQLYYDGEVTPEYSVEPDWFKNEKIRFESEDENVFTVTSDGTIKAVSIGEADLHMKAKEYSEKTRIKIVPKVTSITGVEERYLLYTGDSVQLQPALEPGEFANEPVSFKTADDSVASVNQEGVVTAVGAGDATITVSAGGTSIETTISISDPVVYSTKSSGKSSGSSKKSNKKKSSGSSNGYFGDTEYF